MTFTDRMIELVQPFRKHLWISFAFVVAVRFFSLIAPYFLSRMTQIGMEGGSFEAMLPWIALGFGAYCVHERIGWEHGIRDTRFLTEGLKRHLRFTAMKHVAGLGVNQIKSLNTDKIREVVKSGESSFADLLFGVLHVVAPVLTETVGVSFFLFILEPLVGIIFFFVSFAYLWYIKRVNDRFRPRTVENQRRTSELNKRCSEYLAALVMIQMNVQEERLVAEIEEHALEVELKSQELWVEYMYAAMRRGIIAAFGIYGLYLFTAWLFAGNAERGKNFVMVVLWAQMGFAQLWTLSTQYRNMMGHYATVECFFEIFDLRNPVVVSECPRFPNPLRGGFKIEGVSYGYKKYKLRKAGETELSADKSIIPECQVLALQCVSMDISPGKHVALVGHTGSGKSTLAALLLRADDPSAGRILLDNVDLRSMDPRELRKACVMLEQQVHLLDGTLRENLALACGGVKAVSEERILSAMKTARLDRLWHRLPKGLDTEIGQNGIELSVGERQRVGIARALLRDPRVLIMDEPTSALDAETEGLFVEALKELMKGRTCITIAHRLSTVIDAHEIYLMDGGTAVASGTHRELYVKSELYKKLVGKQISSVPLEESLPRASLV